MGFQSLNKGKKNSPNTVKKIEIITGVRNDGNLEVTEGLKKNDKIVAEGLKKTRPGGKIKPITN